MAANELRVHDSRHLGKIATPALVEQQRQKVHLEQKVAELVEQLLVVIGDGGVGDLVSLLDGVRDDGARRLLAVPGTLAAQPLGQALQFEEGLGEAGQARSSSGSSTSSSPAARSPPDSGSCG